MRQELCGGETLAQHVNWVHNQDTAGSDNRLLERPQLSCGGVQTYQKATTATDGCACLGEQA